MKHTLYATKPLKFDAQHAATGQVLATIETDLPLDRVLAGLGNGSVSLDAPPIQPSPVADKGQTSDPKPAVTTPPVKPAPPAAEPAK